MNSRELAELAAAQNDSITKTFKVTANADMMDRFEEFLAMVQRACAVGHSQMFALSADGDGSDRFMVEPKPTIRDGRKIHENQHYDHVGPE